MRLVIATILIIISTAVSAEPVIEGNAKDLTGFLKDIPNTVTLKSTATQSVGVKKAEVKISIGTEAKRLDEALKKNSAIRSQIREKLSKVNIKDSDIRESKFSSTPEYGLWGDDPKSYKVENALKIDIDTEEKLIQIASITDNLENVRYISTNSKSGNQTKLQNNLIQKALGKIDVKQKLYEKALGFKLKPIKFSESIYKSEQPQQVSGRQNHKSKLYSSYAPSQVQFGESKLVVEVEVEFEVEKN